MILCKWGLVHGPHVTQRNLTLRLAMHLNLFFFSFLQYSIFHYLSHFSKAQKESFWPPSQAVCARCIPFMSDFKVYSTSWWWNPRCGYTETDFNSVQPCNDGKTDCLEYKGATQQTGRTKFNRGSVNAVQAYCYQCSTGWATSPYHKQWWTMRDQTHMTS